MCEQAPPNVKAEFTEAARIEKEEHARLSVQFSLLKLLLLSELMKSPAKVPKLPVSTSISANRYRQSKFARFI